ncbi:MAG: AAA family ATPase [Micavibrio sp.]
MDAMTVFLQDIARKYLTISTDPDHSPDLRAALYDDIRSLAGLARKKMKNPRLDFLRGYFAVVLPELETLTMAEAIDLLEQAHEEGEIEATIFLSVLYGSYDYPVERRLQRPARAILLEDVIGKANHPYGLFLLARRYNGRIDESKLLVKRRVHPEYIGGYFLEDFSDLKNGDEASQKKTIRRWRAGLKKGRTEDILSAHIKSTMMLHLGVALYRGICAKYADPVEGLRLIRDAEKCGLKQAREWLDDNIALPNDEAPDPAQWLSEELAIHNGDGDAEPNDEAEQDESGNTLILNLDRRNSGEFFTLAHPEEQEGKKSDSYKPQVRARIHFPDDMAVKRRQALDADPVMSDVALDAIIAPLENLPGLRAMKTEIRDLLNYAMIIKQRRQHGLSTKSLGMHMLFTGKPGTGKTRLARMIGTLFYEAGLLENGHVIEADSAALTGEYIGWTTSKTRLACEAALGGVLFIDEAYMLTENGWGFGAEAVDVIMKMMEDYNGRFVVIAAGYPEKMDQFVLSNPGLRSRFAKTMAFKDYTAEENAEIFEVFCAENDYVLDPDGRPKLLAYLKSLRGLELERFANARGVRKLFEESIRNQANRLLRQKITGKDDLMQIRAGDIPGPAVIVKEGNVCYLDGTPGKRKRRKRG